MAATAYLVGGLGKALDVREGRVAHWRVTIPAHAPSASVTLRTPYRGRLAPSPTGLLHLGHARTFYTAWERARAAGGALILRDEDLDPQRCRDAFAQAMLDDLRWLGLDWDEGPDVGGPCAPYRQSERRALYLAAWRQLVERGWVYPCTCSRREVRESAGAPHEDVAGALHAITPGGGANETLPADAEPIYPGSCRPAPNARPTAPPASPAGVNWRFRVPDGRSLSFDDAALGPQTFVAGRDIGDFLVWRRDDVAAYQLAVVVDDAAMRITEVVRGEDLLRSTARQLLLYEVLGLESPSWFHCPLVRDEHHRRLAKRADAVSLRALREAGRSAAEVVSMAFGMAGAIAGVRVAPLH